MYSLRITFLYSLIHKFGKLTVDFFRGAKGKVAQSSGPNIWKAIWVFIQHFPISGIIFRYRELEFPISGNQFPISGNDRFPDIGKWFSISGIDFPISGNVLDLPISGNQFPISENRHPTEAGHSATLQHRPTTPPPINNGPQLYRPHLLVETVITTSVNGYQSISNRLTSCTLAQVMACCWKAPSHYLNQCWLFIKGVMWHLPDNNLTRSALDISC